MRATDPGLDRRAVALSIGMPDHHRAGGAGSVAGLVGRSIVDDKNFAPAGGRRETRDDLTDRGGFVVSGDDDGGCFGRCQGSEAFVPSHQRL